LRKSVDREVCDEARLAILQTDKKYVQMTPKQKKKIVYQEVKQCISRVTKKGSYKMAYFLGEAADRVSCCKKAFDKYHRINHTYVDALVKYHKKKVSIHLNLSS
jgi:ABC-type transporter MlaC component